MQQEFGGIKRVLVLKADEVVTSDDPMEAWLEMKGWRLSRVRELMRSIHEKQIPPLFGEPEELNMSERHLLRAIDEYQQRELERRSV